VNNMDVFNLIALEVFHLSLESFPIPVDTSRKKIAESVSGYLEIIESKADEKILEDQVGYTVWWLRDEQFITLKREALNGSFSASLTQKGLNAVNSNPQALETKKSFRELFYQGLANLPFTVASGTMVEFFKSSG